MKAEFAKDVTIGMLMTLNEQFGITVVINDGEIVEIEENDR